MVATVIRPHRGAPPRLLPAREDLLPAGRVGRGLVGPGLLGPGLLGRGLVGWGLVGSAAALVPWIWVLANTLPSTATVSNWSTAWVGLDAMEAAALLGTGVLFLRRDPRYGLGAAVAGTLLAVDAWLDVTTATPGTGRVLAIMLAAGLELPLATLCATLAARSFTQPGAMIDAWVNSDRQSLDGSTPDG
ncbi:LPXTG cell wall anchor domain-containing protein [Actinomadura chokoriensis]|uniref:LPXTG cell wall anchor domain-containing protein n=1 Tax=Actinomadura chokoriensis TaxID=454156 RepID=A0ABV4QRH5_9ACTN